MRRPPGLHVDRASGRHRDHRNPDRPVAPRGAEGPRGCRPDACSNNLKQFGLAIPQLRGQQRQQAAEHAAEQPAGAVEQVPVVDCARPRLRRAGQRRQAVGQHEEMERRRART